MRIRPFLLASSIALSRVSGMVTPKIKNIEYNSCRNCKHLIPNDIGQISSSSTRCNMFGKKDIVTDEITFDYTDNCRSNESKCGIEAKYFEKEENLILKRIIYHIKTFSFLYSTFGSIFIAILYNIVTHNY